MHSRLQASISCLPSESVANQCAPRHSARNVALNESTAELLCEKTLAMVMRYAHLAPDYQLAAGERMGKHFPAATTTATERDETRATNVSPLQ